MTTPTSKGGEKAATSNDTHLISDHDTPGDHVTWCGAEFANSTESIAETTCINCLRTVMIYADGAREQLKLMSPFAGTGREQLWGWFELSYASFLTIPRVLMHEMPDDWQGKMADLLEEYSATFPNWPDGVSTRVQYTMNNHLAPMPAWLTDYRHPNNHAAREAINALRGNTNRQPDAATQHCPGCDEDLPKTDFWHVAGDLWLCNKCTEALPPFPQHTNEITLKGKYPDFTWERSAS